MPHSPKEDTKNINVQTKKITVNKVFFENQEQLIVRDKVNIPSNLPGLEKITSHNHFVHTVNVEMEETKIIYEGLINLQISYSAVDGEIYQFSSSIRYHNFFDVPKNIHNMTAVVLPQIRDIYLEHNKLEKTITVQAELNVQARVKAPVDEEFLVTAPPQCKPLTKQVKLNEILKQHRCRLKKEVKITIPSSRSPAKDLFNFKCTPLIQNYKLELGSVNVNGWLQLDIYYSDDAHNMQHLHRLIPFSSLIPVPEARSGCLADVQVKSHNSAIKILPDFSGFSIQVEVEYFIQLLAVRYMNVIAGLENYSFKAVPRELTVENLTGIKSTEVVIRDSTELLSEFVNCSIGDVRVGPVTILSTEVIKNKVLMYGSADFILQAFESNLRKAKSIYRKIFFKAVTEIDTTYINVRVETLPVVEYVSAFLQGGRLTIEAVLHIIVRTLVLDKYQIISNIESLRLQQKESSKSAVTFKYVVKDGEWLEDLAERFGTSVKEILKVNPGLNIKQPVWGKTLCIPCQVKNE